ncbi:CLUMA_CG006381, isoform A [Clunio marinus]|uniref:CLUMA_CG006381, isoform A n=1 Tax=Clunio marinus TaxID=568069 RepID=A0A1J1I1G4_9DIPT|nr:CLUMA_CG006381, isoform A [Clunio marinus]
MKPFISSPIYTATKHAILGLSNAYGVSIGSFFQNRLDHVASEAIPVILNASSGSLWIVMNDEIPGVFVRKLAKPY